jgi:hypothetical protein
LSDPDDESNGRGFDEPDTSVEDHQLCPRCGSMMFDDSDQGGEFITVRCLSCRYGKMVLRERP